MITVAPTVEIPPFPGFWRFVWMFWMQPMTLHRVLRERGIEPNDRFFQLWRLGATNPSARRYLGLAVQTLLGMVCGVMPALAFGGAGLLALAGFDVPWEKVAFNVAFGVAGGVAVGVAFGVAGGVAFGMAFGVAFCMAFGVGVGVAFGVAFGVTGGVAIGVAFGLALGVGVGGLVGVAGGVAGGVGGGVAEWWPCADATGRHRGG